MNTAMGEIKRNFIKKWKTLILEIKSEQKNNREDSQKNESCMFEKIERLEEDFQGDEEYY